MKGKLWKALMIDGKHSHGNGDRSSNHQAESRIGMVGKHGLPSNVLETMRSTEQSSMLYALAPPRMPVDDKPFTTKLNTNDLMTSRGTVRNRHRQICRLDIKPGDQIRSSPQHNYCYLFHHHCAGCEAKSFPFTLPFSLRSCWARNRNPDLFERARR